MAYDLNSIAPTKHAAPPRIVVHAGEKVGKSTFFSQAPSPIFIQTEDGLTGINAQAFPLCESYEDIIACLTALSSEDHNFQTVVIDSMDWAERLIHEKVCRDEGVPTIEKAAGGYGKGYQIANDHFRNILSGLNYLNKERGLIVGIICHSKLVTVQDPELEPVDCYRMKLHSPRSGNGIGDILNEWADVIGFASIVKRVAKREGSPEERKSFKAVKSTGERKLYLDGSPAFVAGNRYGLPSELPLTWAAFSDALAISTQQLKEAS